MDLIYILQCFSYLDNGNRSSDDDDDCLSILEIKRRIKNLPRVVQEYFNAVIHNKAGSGDDVVPLPRSLSIKQGGAFLLNGKWISFAASQKFRTRYNCPGFVWDAVMKIETFLSQITIPITVCDAYVDGIGIMKAQLPGGIPIVRQRMSRELDEGELLRWVTEAVLFPLALLPSIDVNEDEAVANNESLRWLPSGDGDENSAILELKYDGNIARVTFYFDPVTHFISSVKAMRPRAIGSKYEMTIWEGFYSHYEIHGGLHVPTMMEAGWRLGSDAHLEIYFKGTNREFAYLT